MTSPVILESFYTAAFLVSESRGWRSRDLGTIENSTTLAVTQPGGMVLSLNVTGTAVGTAGSNTGTGTLTLITQGNLIMVGTYTLTATAATVFSVTDPNGDAMASAHTGVAYTDAELGFTLTASGTAFVAGDSFTIAVPAGDGNFVTYTGTHPAAAILYNRVENIPAIVSSTPGTKAITVIDRDAEVNASELQWDPTVIASGSVATLQANALTSLKALGIKAR